MVPTDDSRRAAQTMATLEGIPLRIGLSYLGNGDVAPAEIPVHCLRIRHSRYLRSDVVVDRFGIYIVDGRGGRMICRWDDLELLFGRRDDV